MRRLNGEASVNERRLDGEGSEQCNQRKSDKILQEAWCVSIELNEILQHFLQSGKQSLNQKNVRM